jgi:hypothetical protein
MTYPSQLFEDLVGPLIEAVRVSRAEAFGKLYTTLPLAEFCQVLDLPVGDHDRISTFMGQRGWAIQGSADGDVVLVPEEQAKTRRPSDLLVQSVKLASTISLYRS